MIRAALLFALALPLPALAADPEVLLVLREHRFEPAELRVPAGVKIKLVVDNQDSTAAEFESHALNREKLVQPQSKAVLFVGPLKPGRYEFFDDFREKTTRGVLIAE